MEPSAKRHSFMIGIDISKPCDCSLRIAAQILAERLFFLPILCYNGDTGRKLLRLGLALRCQSAFARVGAITTAVFIP